MEEKLYSLMHRDGPICMIAIDPVSGAIHRVSKTLAPELLPLGGSVDSAMLKNGGRTGRFLSDREKSDGYWKIWGLRHPKSIR